MTPPVNDGQQIYSVQAEAIDGQGNTITFPAATLTVNNTPPTAALTAALPSDSNGGLIAPTGLPINLSSTVTDPSAADTTAGKTSLVYKAHSYPTKVPHEAIMRLILHYTEPGDVVLVKGSRAMSMDRVAHLLHTGGLRKAA